MPSWAKEGARKPRKKQQVPPLRFAPVGMTILLDGQVLLGEILASTTELSSRPERTRISYIAIPHNAKYAAFLKESRMTFANATELDRKSGVA